jgi:hypothetical protein
MAHGIESHVSAIRQSSYSFSARKRDAARKKLREYFGESVELIDLLDLERKFGQIGIGSKMVLK